MRLARGKRVTRPGPDRVFQLLPWMSALDNVMFPLIEIGKLKGSTARDKVMEYIEKVNLVRVADSYVLTRLLRKQGCPPKRA